MKMATTIDKHYATDGEKQSLTRSEDQPFNNEYERISNAKPSISEDQPFTDSQMLRDPRSVSETFFLIGPKCLYAEESSSQYLYVYTNQEHCRNLNDKYSRAYHGITTTGRKRDRSSLLPLHSAYPTVCMK